jgi:hypothetical protein
MDCLNNVMKWVMAFWKGYWGLSPTIIDHICWIVFVMYGVATTLVFVQTTQDKHQSLMEIYLCMFVVGYLRVAWLFAWKLRADSIRDLERCTGRAI